MSCSFEMVKDEIGNRKYILTISNGDIKEFKTKGCFIAIGQIPQNEIFKELVDLNKGFIITNEKMETKTSGLYAIGDCKDKLLRQLTTSFNDGSIAAYFASHYIDTNF